MRWRLGLSLLTVLTAMIAVGTAALGPLYLHTAGDSVLRRTVSAASIAQRGVTLPIYQGQPGSLHQVQQAERVVQRLGGHHPWYGAPITSAYAGVTLTGTGRSAAVRASPFASQLFARTGVCAVLHFVKGGCDLGAGDVVVSARSARSLHAGVGTVLPLGVKGRGAPLPVTITGIYAVPNLVAPYWWGNGPGDFPFGQTSGGQRSLPELDPLITSTATALNVPLAEVPQVVGQVPLRSGAITLGDASAVQQGLHRATAAVGASSIQLSTQLPALLAAADHRRHVMSTIVAIAAAQLVLLAIWVLASLLMRSSDARRSEIRVARLRGFPPISMLWVTAAEPALLCLIGAVVGVGVALAAVSGARAQLFAPGSAIAIDGWTLAALGLTVLAIAGALGIGTVRLLRSTGLSESQSASTDGASVAGVVADAVLVVLAIVALIALSTSGALAGHTNPVASAAPGLIALGTAVLAVQVILFACRLGISASADSKWVAPFLALRQTVRRPELLRQARVLVIALGLACFATSAWSVARSNRAAVAGFDVGASKVVTVAPKSASGLEQAVDRVDPHGRFAMAAITLQLPSSDLLAVDASRLSAVASWPSDLATRRLSAIGRALAPRAAPEVTLPAGRVQVSASTAVTSPVGARVGNLDVGMWVFNPGSGTTIIDLGPVHAGQHTYTGDLATVCGGGCRLAGIGVVPAVDRQPPTAGTVSLTMSGLSVVQPSGAARQIPADLVAGGWRSGVAGVTVTASGTSALTFAIPASAIDNETSATGTISPPMAAPADHPTTLPAAVTTELQSLNGGGQGASVPAQGLDGNTLNLAPAVAAPALPRVGGNAVMVDVSELTRTQVNPTKPAASDEVWLGPHAPSDVLARLRDAGLTVDAVQTTSSTLAQLQRSAPALADDFLLVAAIAALLTAAASTLGALGATTRERATELVSLEVAGVSRPVLARSLAFEAGILGLTALCGAAAGVIAALLAIPSLPELSATPLIPLHYGLPAGIVAAVSVVVLIVIGVACVSVATILLRRMSPSLLRTVPDDAAG